MNQVIHDALVKLARKGETDCYENIGRLVGLSMSDEGRYKLATYLEEISRYEFEHGRPLLSAVVVWKDAPLPGAGFFTLARQLGLLHEEDDVVFYSKELVRVHDYWRGRK